MAKDDKFKVKWSAEDECFLATSYELVGLTAHGDTEEEAIQQLMLLIHLVKKEYNIKDRYED